MPNIRLYINTSFTTKQYVELPDGQAHYINHVMRQKSGNIIQVFNGTEGLWQATIQTITRKQVTIQLDHQIEPQTHTPDIWLCFAPVKNAPLQTLIQKATELGVSEFHPVETKHTVVHRLPHERLLSQIIEAAEQCRRLTLPTLHPLCSLEQLLQNWDPKRKLILCDESGEGKPIIEALTALPKTVPLAVFIGPEGGFSTLEFEILRKQPYIVPVGMGPRILRADTAAISALACCMSILGDWHTMPSY